MRNAGVISQQANAIIPAMKQPVVPSHDILRAAIDKAGVKTVAAELGLSQAMVYKWCAEPDASGTPNPLDRLRTVVALSGDMGPVVWLCEVSGGYFVRNPEPRKPSAPLAVLSQTQQLVRRFSDMLEEISKSMADGEVDPNEARRIRTEWEELKRHAEGFVGACEPRPAPKP